MTELCAIEADYVNWRPVNGRKVLQLVFEVPLELTHDVLTRLGTPTPGESKWCAIALLDPDAPAKPTQAVIDGQKQIDELYRPKGQAEGGSPKKAWNEYKPSQQITILCGDEAFQRYFGARNEDEALATVKEQLRVKSRREIDREPGNTARWNEMHALYNLHRERHK